MIYEELYPIHDFHKSFYGKAKVLRMDNGVIRLQSYNTIVAEIDGNGKFHRLWGGYSPTSMRHINEFSKQCGDGSGGKKWWESLEVES